MTVITPGLSGKIVLSYVADGLSIRDCAARAGTSYGATRRALLNAGVILRPRGGS